MKWLSWSGRDSPRDCTLAPFDQLGCITDTRQRLPASAGAPPLALTNPTFPTAACENEAIVLLAIRYIARNKLGNVK